MSIGIKTISEDPQEAKERFMKQLGEALEQTAAKSKLVRDDAEIVNAAGDLEQNHNWKAGMMADLQRTTGRGGE